MTEEHPPIDDGAHDFDFLHGRWRVRNRRLVAPLCASSDWIEFDGQTVETSIWDGQANLEEYDATLPDGARIRGLALRLYDPQARQWTIHWSNAAAGTLDRPMTGAFVGGRGTFYSQEPHAGRTIFVRFLWTTLGPTSCRWEQAFSPDLATWETNWIMEFTRDER